jgi:hypothetical protein
VEYPHDAKEHLALATEKLEAMRVRAGHGPSARWTVSGMVENWKELVDQVERGYDEMIYEYTNDLSVRGLLEELIDALPPGSVRSWVTQEVEATDARYRAATREVNEPIHGGGSAPWWYWGVPKVLVGELRGDLGDAG